MNKAKHARETALGLLARRDHSAFELAQKLKQHGYDAVLINEVLSYCRQHDYQSDSRFVDVYCRTRIRQGYGPLTIVQSLKQHQISAEEIKACLARQDVNWLDLASLVLKKHAWRF